METIKGFEICHLPYNPSNSLSWADPVYASTSIVPLLNHRISQVPPLLCPSPSLGSQS